MRSLPVAAASSASPNCAHVEKRRFGSRSSAFITTFESCTLKPGTMTLSGGTGSVMTRDTRGGLVLGFEEALGGELFPDDDAGRKYVRAAIERLFTGGLFGRHVRYFAFELTNARGRQATGRAGHAEIRDARDAVDTDEHVLRRDGRDAPS